ncbi:ABC transporter substrate-binding protein [Hoeflea sp. WL0058]|uniref:ABC transporter substrate-binding protein n=1 Tax=Flavimaribacter sediminis TaxID=2865987 RepID=A0AAE2ZLF2_9HYPH|nr:ABC transporter substrate-binding protein [Flavimaribacter sediminis]MBW8636493.1 ABC transporter substrate-binding protein [Flavimaribacter sediminis]
MVKFRSNRLLAALLLAILMDPTGMAHAQSRPQGLRIGIFAPSDGNFSILGEQVDQGVRIFADTAPGSIVDIVDEPDNCDAESGADAASAFVEAGVDVVIGFLCMESLASALPILSSSDIPAITLGVRSELVSEDADRFGWEFYRLAPSVADESDKIAETIATQWSGKPLALIDDGTVYGRELAESVRLALETTGIKPVFVDNYRPSQEKQFPLVRRLEKSGATHIFLGGDRPDAAIIARDAAEAGLELTFMGGDALNAPDADPPLANGVFAVMLPGAETLDTAAAARAVFERTETPANGYRIPAFAAAQIALASKRSAEMADTSVAQEMSKGAFRTALGPISFAADGDRRDNPMRLMVWRDVEFVPADSQ